MLKVIRNEYEKFGVILIVFKVGTWKTNFRPIAVRRTTSIRVHNKMRIKTSLPNNVHFLFPYVDGMLVSYQNISFSRESCFSTAVYLTLPLLLLWFLLMLVIVFFTLQTVKVCLLGQFSVFVTNTCILFMDLWEIHQNSESVVFDRCHSAVYIRAWYSCCVPQRSYYINHCE